MDSAGFLFLFKISTTCGTPEMPMKKGKADNIVETSNLDCEKTLKGRLIPVIECDAFG
jgi:hypothetical protein